MKKYTEPSEFIDSNNIKVRELTNDIVGNLKDNTEITKKLFFEIRDRYSYVPFKMDVTREGLKASSQVDRETGYCVSKALLLSACLRSKGIPARACFFNVRNHLGTGKLEAALKTDLIVFHGAAEVYLKDKWIKLVPAFDRALCEKLGVSTIDFDGENDAIFQEFKPTDGQVSKSGFMEYTHEYGSFTDFPYDLAVGELRKHYPDAFDESVPEKDRILFSKW